jgi:hypothetical protein
MSTCKSTEKVTIVGGGFSECGNAKYSGPIFLEFDGQAGSKNKLIRRVFISLDPNGQAALNAFAKRYANDNPLDRSTVSRNSTRCGKGDVVVVNAARPAVQNIFRDARIIITAAEAIKVNGVPCDSPKRIAFAQEVEDFSKADAIAYIKAIKAAG